MIPVRGCPSRCRSGAVPVPAGRHFYTRPETVAVGVRSRSTARSAIVADEVVGIVGAGIVGLAIGREITRRRPGTRVVLLEKEPRVAAHQTGHNSGVVHAGIYYTPGSLKAVLCSRGAAMLRE